MSPLILLKIGIRTYPNTTFHLCIKMVKLLLFLTGALVCVIELLVFLFLYEGNNWSREEEDNRHDYEKRRLKGLQHENQTTNVTTTQENEVLDSRNSVPTNSKEIIRMNQRTTPVSHVKQISPSWKTFNWTSEVTLYELKS